MGHRLWVIGYRGTFQIEGRLCRAATLGRPLTLFAGKTIRIAHSDVLASRAWGTDRRKREDAFMTDPYCHPGVEWDSRQ